MSDISETLTPKSDQINADDLIGSTMNITVDRVVIKSGQDQPLDIHTVETPGRAYRPSKTMRRLIAHAWGTDSAQWTGKSLTLYRNPEIKFGKEQVGGIEISHMSHIDKAFTVALTSSKARKRSFHVKPLEAPQQPDWQALLQAAQGDRDKLLALHARATNENAPQDILDAIIQAGQQATQPPQQEELGDDQ